MRRAIEQVAANAKSLRLWQLIKASGMPVYPLVILWGGSKNARPSDPLAIGETPVADRPQGGPVLDRGDQTAAPNRAF